jgi:hypothetical protein
LSKYFCKDIKNTSNKVTISQQYNAIEQNKDLINWLINNVPVKTEDAKYPATRLANVQYAIMRCKEYIGNDAKKNAVLVKFIDVLINGQWADYDDVYKNAYSLKEYLGNNKWRGGDAIAIYYLTEYYLQNTLEGVCINKSINKHLVNRLLKEKVELFSLENQKVA